MLDIAERLFVDWLVPDDKRDDDTYLLKLCVSALSGFEDIEVPDKYKVEFDPDNHHLGEFVCLNADVLFPYATSVFLNKEKAHITIKRIESSTLTIGLNILMILDCLDENDSDSFAFYRYKEKVSSHNLLEILVDKEIFDELRAAVLYLPLDLSDRIVHMRSCSGESGNAVQVAMLMKNSLKLSREDQISFLFFERKVTQTIKKRSNSNSYTEKQCNEIVMRVLSYLNLWETFKRSKKYISNAMKCVIAIENVGDSLPILKALEVYKKTNNYTRNKLGDTVYSPGAVYDNSSTALIETSILKEEIRALCLCENKDRPKLVIINPSISLVEGLVIDKEIQKSGLTFVIDAEKIVSLLSGRNSRFVSFLSFPSYISSDIPERGEIIFCINPEVLPSVWTKEISNRKRRNTLSKIIALDNDNSFKSKTSLACSEIDYISSLTLLPLGLEGGAKGKFDLWFSTGAYTDTVAVESVVKKSVKEKSVMKNDGKASFMKDMLFYQYGDVKLRSRKRKLEKTAKSYIPNQPYYFSDNIKVYYAGLSFFYLFWNENLKVTFSIQYRNGDRFNPVGKAKFSKTFSSLDDANVFLHNGYLFYEKSMGRKGTSEKYYIGELVRTEMSRAGVKYPTSLKEFVFLFYKELKVSMDEVDIKVLIDIALNSKLSGKSIALIMPEEVIDTVSEEEKTDLLFGRVFNVFALAFEVAKKNHLIYKNEFREVQIDRLRWSRLFGRVRGLVKKNFTRDEFRTIYSYLSASLERKIQDKDDTKKMEKKEKQKGLSLCVLISLLTGMEANVVCALKWKDFKRTSFGFYEVRIVRQLTNDGKEERGIVDIHDYRTLPLGRILSKLLDEVYSKVELHASKEGKNRKSLGELYVSGCFCDTITKMKGRTAPQDVSKEINRIIEKVLGIKEQLVYVPDWQGGTKEVNLSRYYGDFLRENFKYHASDLAGFTEDEIAYYVGNTCVTTMGCHYIDYGSEMMILNLNTKLDRISSFLEQDSKSISSKSGAFFRSAYPTTLDAAFTTESGCCVMIKVSHGAFISVEEDDGVYSRQYLQEL